MNNTLYSSSWGVWALEQVTEADISNAIMQLKVGPSSPAIIMTPSIKHSHAKSPLKKKNALPLARAQICNSRNNVHAMPVIIVSFKQFIIIWRV